MVEKVVVTRFSDPMMGLAWECEPMLRKVEVRFGGQVELREAMGVLVRDVFDFMTSAERALPDAEGLAKYNVRLAQIYLEEEPIAGMPIDMDGFELFGVGRRSSLQLCLAYEAARLTCPERAAEFLYRLRFETVVQGSVTNCEDELARMAVETGIDAAAFRARFEGGEALAALKREHQRRSQLGLWGLPAFLVECSDAAMAVRGVPTYAMLESAIVQVSGGAAKPLAPTVDADALRALLREHPLLSLVEVAAAFDLAGVDDARGLAASLVAAGEAAPAPSRKGEFLRKTLEAEGGVDGGVAKP